MNNKTRKLQTCGGLNNGVAWLTTSFRIPTLNKSFKYIKIFVKYLKSQMEFNTIHYTPPRKKATYYQWLRILYEMSLRSDLCSFDKSILIH